jgi:hypothetical protein
LGNDYAAVEGTVGRLTIALAASLICAGPLAAQVQPPARARTAQQVIAALSSQAPADKAAAAREIAANAAHIANPDVQDAVLVELRRLTDAETRRYEPATRGQPVEDRDPLTAELILALVDAAAQMNDPVVVSVMVRHLGTPSANERIARLGTAAVAPLMRVYQDARGAAPPTQLRGGVLRTLSILMNTQPLAERDRAVVLPLVRGALDSTNALLVQSALHAAVATKDSTLVDIVKQYAAESYHSEQWTAQQLQLLRSGARELLTAAGIRIPPETFTCVCFRRSSLQR